MINKLPSISIVIPTYNEEQHIKTCLDSIFKQDYPKKLLEVFLVDNYSEDKTVEIAKKYPVVILMNKIKDAQVSKMLAFNKSKGDLFFYMDADLQLRGNNYLKSMVKPLLEDSEIVGSFSRMYQLPNDLSLNRFLTHDPLQRDPIYEFFSSSIDSTITEKREGYSVCTYKIGKIPPAGRCLYWKSKLLQTPIAEGKKFMELDNLVILVENGFSKFAYVPLPGEYHRHIENIRQLVKKRLRNINRNYLPTYKTRKYTWFDLKNKKDILKIIVWIVYAHLIIPAFIRGCVKTIRYRDFYCILYEPFLTLLLTDIILYGFLSNPRGINFIKSKFLN